MDFELWKKVLWYTNCKKYYIPKGPLSDKILFKKVSEKFIINKFIEKWSNKINDDPIEIIDAMILNYSIWEQGAIEKNNDELIKIYDTYIKTLFGIKNFIIKETKI